MDGLENASAGVAVPRWAVQRRFEVTNCYRMADAGIFGEDDPYELVEGEIIEIGPIGGPHIGTVTAVTRAVVDIVASPDP